MLLYHPAFDPYHTAFRFALLLWNYGVDLVPFRRLRILDFYLLFPGELERVRFPRNLLLEKKKWAQLRSRYNSITDPRRIFDELESFQMSGIQLLVAATLVTRDTGRDVCALVKAALPAQFVQELEAATVKRAGLLKLLTDSFRDIDLYGDDGLKARTGLFEYRYDSV